MPIYQIPSNDLRVNHTFSGSAEPNARVLLWNPVEGRYVKSINADDNGNFDFGSLDSSVPLQIKIVRNNDFTCEATSPIIKPSATPQLHTGKMITKLQYFPGAEGQHYFINAPKGIFIDRNGPGSGAEITFELASPGDIFIQLGTDVPYDPYVYADINYIPSVGGHPLKAYTITSFGHSYVDPVLIFTGTIRIYPSQFNYGWGYFPGINPSTGETYKQTYPGGKTFEGTAPPPAEYYAGYGWEVSGGTWWGKLDIYEEIPCFTCPTDANDLINNIISRWGQADTWGQYSAGTPKTYGPRLMAQVPGYSNIKYNSDCTTEDNTQPGPVLQEKIVEIMAATKNPTSAAVWESAEYALYLAIIHGHEYEIYNGEYVSTGQPRAYDNSTPNQNLPNSAFIAQSNGIISSAELEYLKGWVAQSVQVNAMINKFNADYLIWKTNNTAVLTATGYTNIGLNIIFATIGEGLHQLGDVIKRWNQSNATSSNYLQNLSQVFWQEWQQTKLRYPAYIDGATGNTKRIKDILTKMGNANGSNYLTGIKTNDSTGTYRWDFSGNTLQKIKIN